MTTTTYTKRQALLDCIEMWHELSVTGDSDKSSTAICRRTDEHCAFCYYKRKMRTACEKCCPAYYRWGNGTESCVNDNSYFGRWIGKFDKQYIVSNNPSKRSRQYWARQIVLMCQQLLLELED